MYYKRPESFLSSLLQSTLWKGLDRIAGLAKHVFIAATIGLSAQLDVFYMSVSLLGVLVFSLANLMDVMAVPHLVKLHQQPHNDTLRRTSSGLFALTLSVSLFLTLLLWVTWRYIAVVVSGFDAERQITLQNAIVWLLPVVALSIPFRCLGAILRAGRRFSTFYQAECLVSVTVLITIICCASSPAVLFWSLSLGTIIAFIYLLFHCWRVVLPLTNPFSHEVLSTLSLAPALIVLHASYYVFMLTDRFFVSYLPTGALSALAYGMTIVVLFPSLVSPSSSFITILAENSDRLQRMQRLNEVISLVIFLSVGIITWLFLAGKDVIKFLLERGAFTASDTETVYLAVQGYIWMVPAFILVGLCDQVFQIEQRLWFMVYRTILGLLVNAVLTGCAVFYFEWGIFGVALATSIAYFVMLFSAFQGLKKMGYKIWVRQHLCWLLWLAGSMCVLYAITLPLQPYIHHHTWLALLVWSVLCGVMLLLAGMVYPRQERQFVRFTLRRLLLVRSWSC